MFDLTSFIDTYVTHREESMFKADIDMHKDDLRLSIEDKSVLVIGGAGTIGSSFIRAILPFHPSELHIVDINENALAELTRSLRSDKELSAYIPAAYIPYPMDYNSITFERLFRNRQKSCSHKAFDIVANFAAHKHVRSERDIYSVECLLRNNVLNVKKLLDLLKTNPPKIYFCVSTDKAANPVNIMGSSKRIMEDLIFSYSNSFKISTARFANVAFSNGSLLEGFLHRLLYHQPLSAPSDVKRYFVSPQESGQICMLSAVLGNNREIFFPKLAKESMTTFDVIARDFLHEHGYEIDECSSDAEAVAKSRNWTKDKPYPVHFSLSDTSGEKAYEEFYTDSECVDLNRFESLGVITGKPVPDRLTIVDILEKAFEEESCIKADIVKMLEEYLPDFEHIETGKSLDGKM